MLGPRFDGAKGRYAVRLQDGVRVLLRPQNALAVAREGATAGQATAGEKEAER